MLLPSQIVCAVYGRRAACLARKGCSDSVSCLGSPCGVPCERKDLPSGESIVLGSVACFRNFVHDLRRVPGKVQADCKTFDLFLCCVREGFLGATQFVSEDHENISESCCNFVRTGDCLAERKQLQLACTAQNTTQRNWSVCIHRNLSVNSQRNL